MYASLRHRLVLLATALCLVSAPARAWVETQLESAVTTVDLRRDGQATIGHELTLRVRGGPCPGLELAGVDADAEPLPEASVVRVAPGSEAQTPIPLVVERRDDGTLAIEVDAKEGLRRGTFRFRFGYRTRRFVDELVPQAGDRVLVSWVGPRFADGLDSATVVFRLPAASTPPELPPVPSEGAALGLDVPGGVFIANLRRAADTDELEVVRPHVAKGEPVVWRVLAHGSAFDAFAPEAAPPPVVTSPSPWARAPEERALVVAGAALVALVYALLVVFKWRWLGRACAARRAVPRALIPLPAAARGALGGAVLVGAGAVAWLVEQPTLAAVLLLGTMALSAHVPPRLLPVPRGPGTWRKLSPEARLRSRPRPGLWFDAGTLPGFALFTASLATAVAGAAYLAPTSPYDALLVVLASTVLVPLFCTGRPSALPPDLAVAPRPLLLRLLRRWRRRPTFSVSLIGRFPAGAPEPDELRALVLPRPRVPGLIGIEVALETLVGSGGPVTQPVVLVRALEGSVAHGRLERKLVWTRGRTSEERVALLRPALPTSALTAELVEVTMALVMEAAGKPRAPVVPKSRVGTGQPSVRP